VEERRFSAVFDAEERRFSAAFDAEIYAGSESA